MRSGLISVIRLRAADPLLTVTTSYPASARIFRPMFWAVTLSSASSILRAKRHPSDKRRDNAKLPCPSVEVNDSAGGNRLRPFLVPMGPGPLGMHDSWELGLGIRCSGFGVLPLDLSNPCYPERCRFCAMRKSRAVEGPYSLST